MAAGIDVFFTGLMLICLAGQPNCPVESPGDYGNTAWVLKADRGINPCGRTSDLQTKLELRFSKDHITSMSSGGVKCDKDGADPNMIVCEDFPEGPICLKADSGFLGDNKFPDDSLGRLPRLDDVDRRFKALRTDLLPSPAVPTYVDFQKGLISAGVKWPNDSRPRLWYRSDRSPGGALPGELSDRLKARYEGATKLDLTDCKGKVLVKLYNPQVPYPQLVFRNRAVTGLDHDAVAVFDNLSHLLWYYRLGLWATDSGNCPEYSDARKDAILLSCVREPDTRACAYFDAGAADTRYWPPMLRPGY